jgi:hypothetical protein
MILTGLQVRSVEQYRLFENILVVTRCFHHLCGKERLLFLLVWFTFGKWLDMCQLTFNRPRGGMFKGL